MKKQLIIILTSLVFLAGTQRATEQNRWEEDDRVFELIDGTIMISHQIGNMIHGDYKHNQDIKGDISGRIDYSGPHSNSADFTGFVYIHEPSLNTLDSTSYIFYMKNITTADAFEKEAQQWAKTEIAKTLFHISADNPNHATIEKELTKALKIAIKKWKDLIPILKANVAEELQNAQKKDDKSPVHVVIEKAKDQLTTLNNQLANFK